MNRLGTVLKAAGVLIAAVLAGFLASWLHGRSLSSNDHISLSEPANTGSANSSAIGSNQGRHPTPESSTTAGLSIGSSAVPSSLITNWEDKVEEILTSGQPDADKTARMLDLFPHLPEDGQVEVAQHLSNLLPDENYAAVGQYLTNSATPEGVLDVLMGGLLNRPNGVKLPWLLEVARQEQNPKSEQAKDLLQIFLEQDNGKDWTKWQAKLDQWLKDNPD